MRNEQMAAILQMTFSIAFLWMKMIEILFKFHQMCLKKFSIDNAVSIG